MEELRLLISMVANLPQMAIWVLVGYLVYKISVIGSIYGVIRFAIAKVVEYLTLRTKEKTEQIHRSENIEIKATIEGMCITKDNTHRALIAQLDRLRGKGTGIESQYIHDRSVNWLREAIDAKEREDLAKNKTA
jgi:hypothetical protein